MSEQTGQEQAELTSEMEEEFFSGQDVLERADTYRFLEDAAHQERVRSGHRAILGVLCLVLLVGVGWSMLHASASTEEDATDHGARASSRADAAFPVGTLASLEPHAAARPAKEHPSRALADPPPGSSHAVAAASAEPEQEAGPGEPMVLAPATADSFRPFPSVRLLEKLRRRAARRPARPGPDVVSQAGTSRRSGGRSFARSRAVARRRYLGLAPSGRYAADVRGLVERL